MPSEVQDRTNTIFNAPQHVLNEFQLTSWSILLKGYPGIPTPIKTMGVNITTIAAYLRVLIIEIGSTIILMVVEAQGVYCKSLCTPVFPNIAGWEIHDLEMYLLFPKVVGNSSQQLLVQQLSPTPTARYTKPKKIKHKRKKVIFPIRESGPNEYFPVDGISQKSDDRSPGTREGSDCQLNSHYLQGFQNIPNGWEWGFWTTNSIATNMTWIILVFGEPAQLHEDPMNIQWTPKVFFPSACWFFHIWTLQRKWLNTKKQSKSNKTMRHISRMSYDLIARAEETSEIPHDHSADSSGTSLFSHLKWHFIIFILLQFLPTFWVSGSKRIPKGSMYGIFTYIWLIFMVNVGKYTIHGSLGIYTSQKKSKTSRWWIDSWSKRWSSQSWSSTRWIPMIRCRTWKPCDFQATKTGGLNKNLTWEKHG